MRRIKKTEKISDPDPEFRPDRIEMIAGLGNPGSSYQNTYHNAGYLAVQYLSDRAPEAEWHQGKKFLYLKTNKYILIKPSVFMNDSGEAVKQALKHFKIKPENLLVVNDDSDLEAGEYKIGFGRGPAGHRGAASVINALKTKDFWRARIGARSQPGKAGDFILNKITPGDRKNITAVFQILKQLLNPNP